MLFRKDINGLRAIAVIAVVLYHFGVSGFDGGFAGVDVFFVLSGFLMAGIILGKMEKDQFSLKDFYLSRARRIVPALAVLCATLLVFGWFWIAPGDYYQLSKQASSSLIFVSNFIFKAEAGYFDTLSQDKWLLHTWSLSVEWQFYLLFPLLLMLIKRFNKSGGFPLRKITISLIILYIITLAFSVIMTPLKASMAFFLLPARIWELVAGALVFIAIQKFTPSNRLSWAFFGTGILLILISIHFFSELTEWPGYAALTPVIGTSLVILANRQNTFLLSNFIFQKIGLWSYSIYLWHWPVFVGLNQLSLTNNPLALMGGILVSVLLGYLSYRFVETPIRFSKEAKKKTLSGSPLKPKIASGAFLALALSGMVIYYNDGFPSRVPDHIRVIEETMEEPKKFATIPCDWDRVEGIRLKDQLIFSSYPDCKSEEKPAYVVWGDSHAGALYPSIYKASDKIHGLALTGSCPPVLDGYLDSKKRSPRCENFAERSIEKIATLPADVPLIIAFRFSYYIHGPNEKKSRNILLSYHDVSDKDRDLDPEGVFKTKLIETLCAVPKAKQRPVYVVRPTPEMGVNVPRALSRQIMFNGAFGEVSLPRQEYDERHALVNSALDTAASQCGIKIIDPTPTLCDDLKCYGSKDNTALYYDDDHLSQAGSALLIPLFKKVLN